MKYNIECGDVILFNRNCSNMSIIPSSICYGAKLSSYSYYDHVGIVIEDINDPYHSLYLLEANMNGITMKLLSDRLKKTKSNNFAIRKLISSNKNIEWKTNLWNMAQNRLNSGYNQSFIEMSKAVITSYTNDRNIINKAINIDFNNILFNNTNRIQTNKLNLFQLIKDHYNEYNNKITPFAINDVNISSKIESKYFCSQLVAELLILSGVLDSKRHFNSFIPSDFSSNCIKQQLFLNQPDHINPNSWYLTPDLTVSKFSIDSNNNGVLTIDTIDNKLPSFIFGVSDILPYDIVNQLFTLQSYRIQSLTVENSPSSCSYFNKSIDSPNELHLFDNNYNKTYESYTLKDKLISSTNHNLSLIAKGKVLLQPYELVEYRPSLLSNYPTRSMDTSTIPYINQLFSHLSNRNIDSIKCHEINIKKGESIPMSFEHGSLLRDYLVIVSSGRINIKSDNNINISDHVITDDHPIILNPLILVGILEPVESNGRVIEANSDCKVILIDRYELISNNIATSPIDWRNIMRFIKSFNNDSTIDITSDNIGDCLNYFDNFTERELLSMIMTRLLIYKFNHNVSFEHILGILCLISQTLTFPLLDKTTSNTNYVYNKLFNKINEYDDHNNYNKHVLNLLEVVLPHYVSGYILQDMYRHRFDYSNIQQIHLNNNKKDSNINSLKLLPLTIALTSSAMRYKDRYSHRYMHKFKYLYNNANKLMISYLYRVFKMIN